MYRLSRPLLFRLDAERAHDATLGALRWASERPGALRLLERAYAVRDRRLEVRAFGLSFPNPVCLAAGMDKNAVAVAAFEALGFGAVEVGSVTARPQPGNPRPRMFRLAGEEAVINRMGFNNEGARAVAARLARLRARGRVGVPIGVNVGKSRDAPLEAARDDYAEALRAVWEPADYLVVNVSSPNTPGLRELQAGAALAPLLGAVADLRDELPWRPVLLKVSPDVGPSDLDGIVDAAERHGIDGIVATNTTTDRSLLRRDPGEPGGLSGRPLADRSLEVLDALRERTRLPVVSVGGIADAADALERLRRGATLVQVYTGLVYRGPGLAGDVCRALLRAMDAVGADGVRAWADGASASAAAGDPP